MSDFLSKHEIRKIDDQIHVLTLRNEDDIWCAQLWEHGEGEVLPLHNMQKQTCYWEEASSVTPEQS